MKAAPTPGEKRKFKATQEPSARERLQGIVEDALNSSNNLFEFLERIREDEAELVLYRFKDDRIGCAFRMDGVTLAGKSLGRGFTWPKIAAQVQYKNDKAHKQAVSALVALEKVRERGLTSSLIIRPSKTGRQKGSAQDSLVLLKVKSEDKGNCTEYRFRPDGRSVIMREYAEKITVGPYSRDAVRAALALARKKGWGDDFSITGRPEAVRWASVFMDGKAEVKLSAVTPGP